MITFKAFNDSPLPWTKIVVYDRDTRKKVAETVLDKPVIPGDTIAIKDGVIILE